MIINKYIKEKIFKDGNKQTVNWYKLECDTCKIQFDKKGCDLTWKTNLHFCSKQCRDAAAKTIIKVAAKQNNIERYGVEHPMQLQESKDRIKEINIENYGVESYFNTEEYKKLKEKDGAIWSAKRSETLKEIYANKDKVEEINNKKKETSLELYGTEWAMQSEEIKKKSLDAYNELRTIPGKSEEIKEKVKQTNLKIFGVENAMQNKDILEKAQQTCLDRYGVKNPLQSPEILEIYKQTHLEKYGKTSYWGSEQSKIDSLKEWGTEYPVQSQEVQDKIFQTKVKNNSFIKSEPEEKVYKILKNHFGENDVIRQFRIKRWSLDFYIPSLDGYVEENGEYFHGLNRSLEEIMKFSNRQDKEIYNHILSDRRKTEYFKQQNKLLAIITDKEVNSLSAEEVLQKILAQLIKI